jgi:hypothetical protein
MNVLPNVPYVFISESIRVLGLLFIVNQFVRSFIQVLHCFSFDRII